MREVADLLALSPTWLRHLADTGRVPAVQHDGTWYFRRRQIEVVANARQAGRETVPDVRQ